MHKGLFITFEGPEGSGKTTLISKLKKYLVELITDEQLPYSGVFSTREPGGKDNLLAESIRNILLNESEENIPALTEAYLFAASRSAHVLQTIQPHLALNEIVLCDRYLDSSIVYQGYVRGLGINVINDINKHAINGLLPDLVFYLDVKPEVGLERIKQGTRTTNRIDNETIDFHKAVAQHYKNHFANLSHVIRLDANLQILELVQQCLEYIQNFKAS